VKYENEEMKFIREEPMISKMHLNPTGSIEFQFSDEMVWTGKWRDKFEKGQGKRLLQENNQLI
jgi:hypothetical protein